MKIKTISCLLSTAVVTAGILVGGDAVARKTVSVRLHNTARDTTMTCSVYKVVTNTNGDDVETRLRRIRVRPGQSARDYSVPVRYIVKRLNGTVVYPRLKLTCELPGQNSRNSSPLWDDTERSFGDHRFFGSCTDGRYCTTRIDRR